MYSFTVRCSCSVGLPLCLPSTSVFRVDGSVRHLRLPPPVQFRSPLAFAVIRLRCFRWEVLFFAFTFCFAFLSHYSLICVLSICTVTGMHDVMISNS